MLKIRTIVKNHSLKLIKREVLTEVKLYLKENPLFQL